MRRSMSCGAYTLSIECDGDRNRGRAIIAAGGGPPGAMKGASALGALDEEIREQRRRPPGAALGRPALVGGAGDVEVRPGHPLRELAEEGRRGDRAAVAAADVGEVGEVALELVEILLGERQLPAAVLGALPGLEQLFDERLVVPEEARMMVAEGDHAG